MTDPATNPIIVPPHLGPVVCAVDFDETVNIVPPESFPLIGQPHEQLIHWLNEGTARGHIVILSTCRHDFWRDGQFVPHLTEALMACADWGLRLYGANVNYAPRTAYYGYDSRKIGADILVENNARVISTPQSLGRWHKAVPNAA